MFCLYHWNYCDYVIESASVESANVVCPHNRTQYLCIFAIFSKTGFLDIVALCCQPSIRNSHKLSISCF